jgi:hypothetical protein
MRVEVTRRIEIDIGFYCENIEYMRIEVTKQNRDRRRLFRNIIVQADV